MSHIGNRTTCLPAGVYSVAEHQRAESHSPLQLPQQRLSFSEQTRLLVFRLVGRSAAVDQHLIHCGVHIHTHKVATELVEHVFHDTFSMTWIWTPELVNPHLSVKNIVTESSTFSS